MSLEIDDGINFTIGQWLGEMMIMVIGVGIAVGLGIVLTSIVGIWEWWNNRRLKK